MNHVEIVTEFEQGLAGVYCDENQMKQVFVNFIKNAIEAMQTGGKLTIQIKKRDDDNLIVRFMDKGTGIPTEILQKMGQPFVMLNQLPGCRADVCPRGPSTPKSCARRFDETHSVVRFCTSWATKRGNVAALIEDIRAL